MVVLEGESGFLETVGDGGVGGREQMWGTCVMLLAVVILFVCCREGVRV
jgi:hypothetical protein